MGIRQGTEAAAVVLDALRQRIVFETFVSGRPVTVWFKLGTASALDAAAVADGRDVGATGVFDPTLDGRRLRFRPDGDSFADLETASRWNILGQAIDGPLAGNRLVPIEHVDTFWFAWAAYLPATTILR